LCAGMRVFLSCRVGEVPFLPTLRIMRNT
jgi:hypothetical protein